MNPQFQITGKLNAFDQLAVARKRSPALPLLQAMVAKDNVDKDFQLLLVVGLGMISDESSEFIINKCISLVTTEVNGQITKIMVNGALMYHNLTMKDLLEVTAKVIQDNLGDFLTTALPK